MASKLRPIKPMLFPDLTPAKVEGEKPVLKWVEPTSLLVDGTYQRDLSERSVRMIRKMIEEFAWNRMKPPIVVKVGPASLHIVDGQHTAIVAATLGVPQIPVFVVKADNIDDRARAFVGHNSDRIVVSPFDIYRALLASGDADTVEVDQVCRKAGVRIRQISPSSAIAEGDTAAVGMIRSLVKRRGIASARKILTCLVKAKCTPVTAAQIRAGEQVICEDFPGAMDLDAFTAVIRIEGLEALNKAHAAARAKRTPLFRELASLWVKRLDRRHVA